MRKDQVLHRFDYHLLKQKPTFFTHSDRISFEMWQIRVQGAMERELEQRKNRPHTMDKFVCRTKRRRPNRRPNRRPLVQEKINTPRYIQRALWSQGEPKDSLEISNAP